jgi:hypothetical protein
MDKLKSRNRWSAGRLNHVCRIECEWTKSTKSYRCLTFTLNPSGTLVTSVECPIPGVR